MARKQTPRNNWSEDFSHDETKEQHQKRSRRDFRFNDDGEVYYDDELDIYNDDYEQARRNRRRFQGQ